MSESTSVPKPSSTGNPSPKERKSIPSIATSLKAFQKHVPHSRASIPSKGRPRRDTPRKFILSNIWQSVWKTLNRIFAFPFLSPPPICFYRQAGEDKFCEEMPPSEKSYRDYKTLEDMVNFDSEGTKELYAKILERRKEINASKDRYHSKQVDVSRFPRWEQSDIDRLRATFQIFDVSGDGLIDFEEFCQVLTEFGDKTLNDVRNKHFTSVEIDEVGTIGFDEFLAIFYRLTMEPVDLVDQSLADTLKKIDKNMSIRSKLTVLEQLQGGLF